MKTFDQLLVFLLPISIEFTVIILSFFINGLNWESTMYRVQ
jgi:hypothetical protein